MEEAVALLIDVAGAAPPEQQPEGAQEGPEQQGQEERLALALHAAEALGWILREGTPILAPRRGLTRVNPLWRQRLFHLAFARLRRALDAHRGGGSSSSSSSNEARAAPLLAICNLVGGLPRAVVQAEVAAIVAVVVQGMSSGHPTLAARATETLAGLARDNVEALVPHLSTLIPLLYGLCTPASPQYLPRARLRVLALQSLMELTRLPYAKLHPYRAQVSRGLLAPLDDRKRLVRQTAVKVRNEWMVMDR